jgi:hypothetical protein
MQEATAQLEAQKSAFVELKESVEAEVRSLQAAAHRNFEEQQRELHHAWELIDAERLRIREEHLELQQMRADCESSDRLNSDRLRDFFEEEKNALKFERRKTKDLQRDNRQQQQQLEHQFSVLQMKQEKLDALDQQRRVCATPSHPLH